MNWFLEFLFGCRHKRTGFPISRRRQLRFGWQKLTGDYVVCLDCGKEMTYDWQEMKVIQTSGKKAVEQKEIKVEMECE